MSKEIKAALHVAMEAIDAKLHRTDLKPGHENDLRAAKGFLRSMISNLPAASGQQEGIEAAFEHAMKTGTGFLRIEAIDPADVFHPAPAQQESEKPYGWVNAGTERQQTIYATLNVGPENPWVETANAFPVYTRATAPAALTNVKTWQERLEAHNSTNPIFKKKRGLLWDAPDAMRAEIEELRAILATASAAPAALAAQPAGDERATSEKYKRQRDALLMFIQNADVSSGVCCCGDDMTRHSNPMHCGHSPVDMWDHSVQSWTDDIAKFDAAIASQQKGSGGHG